MPTIAEYVANYSAGLHYRDLPADTVHLLKRMIIDSIGCAIGGYAAEPSKIARDLAGEVSSRRPVTIIGSGQASSPDLATFANGVMLRYLDFNDGYTTLESGHPSDSIAATLAGAEMAGAGGRRLITATAVAYEAFCRFGDAFSLKYIGFDHVTNGAMASAVGAARALGLSAAQTEQALNLGLTPNLALGQTRVGVLSHWKGCAYANASRNAVFAAMLAERGLTGPAPVFEGEHGFFAAVTREPYRLEPFGGDQGQPFKRASKKRVFAPYGAASASASQSAPKLRCSPAVPRNLCSNAADALTPVCAPLPNAAAIPQNPAASPHAAQSPGGSSTVPAPIPTTRRDTLHQPKSAAAAATFPTVPPAPAERRLNPEHPPDAPLPPAADPPYRPRSDAGAPALFCRHRNRAAPFSVVFTD